MWHEPSLPPIAVSARYSIVGKTPKSYPTDDFTPEIASSGLSSGTSDPFLGDLHADQAIHRYAHAQEGEGEREVRARAHE